MEKYIKAMNYVVMSELVYSPKKNWLTVFNELSGVMDAVMFDPEISLEQQEELLKIRRGMLRIFEALRGA